MMATPRVSFVPIMLVVLQEVRNSWFELVESTEIVSTILLETTIGFRLDLTSLHKEWLLYLWVFSPAINLLGHIVVMPPAGTTYVS
jgi:hypothetical protein